jgi:DNA-binding NtrC family response regulator
MSSRLALVANDQHLARDVQNHLQNSLGQAIARCPLTAARDHLRRENPDLLLVAVASPTECEQTLQLLGDGLRVLLIVPGGEAAGKQFALLDQNVSQRLRWPEEAASLVDIVRQRMNREDPQGVRTDSIETAIRQRLQTQTPSLVGMAEPLALAASHDVTVLLTGETGTGKTYLARLIHEFSPRAERRMLVVPCGALVPALVESEFFGHVKGAFTGADQLKIGKFESVGDGTLLLDEIDALGLEQQAKLLRVLETGEFEPVGSNRTQKCAARVIAASNWDLEQAVASGRFRQDLYYRLHVMSLYLPPLRERVQDIGPLVRHLTDQFAAKFRKPLRDISPEGLAALEAFPWPGNIRQLENAVQQAVLLSNGPCLLLEHLPPPIRDYVPAPQPRPQTPPNDDSLLHSREQVERSVIQRALANCNYSRVRAASALGVSRVTLYKKMKKYGLTEIPVREG